jgi:hypothetical protein
MPHSPTAAPPSCFPDLVWEPGAWAKSCDALFRYAVGEAERALSWYERKRWRAQRSGRGFRLGAILATSAAGVTPILSEIFERDGHVAIDPLWAAFLLALAGIFVLLDRFWGCTSAWVRYVRASQDLVLALDTFRVEWERRKLAWDPAAEDAEVAQAMLECCRLFLIEVRTVVREETEAWAAEFQHVLEQIDRTASEGGPPRSARGALAPPPPAGPDPPRDPPATPCPAPPFRASPRVGIANSLASTGPGGVESRIHLRIHRSGPRPCRTDPEPARRSCWRPRSRPSPPLPWPARRRRRSACAS